MRATVSMAPTMSVFEHVPDAHLGQPMAFELGRTGSRIPFADVDVHG